MKTVLFSIIISIFLTSFSANATFDIYNQALQSSDPQFRCETFQRLGQDNEFPLQAMAKLRSFESCDEFRSEELWQIVESNEYSWMSPTREVVALPIAQAMNNHQKVIELTPVVLGQVGSQTEKEELIRQAIQAAEATSNPSARDRFVAKLYSVSPRLHPNPPKSTWLKVAKDYRENLQWDTAVSFYQRVFDDSSFSLLNRLKAKNGIRFLYKMRFRFHGGALEDFLSHASSLADFCSSQLRNRNLSTAQKNELTDAWLQYARDHWTYGDVATAREIVSDYLRHARTTGFFSAKGHFLRSRIRANYNEWQGSKESAAMAIRKMNGLHQRVKWQKELWDDTHWRQARNFRKLGQLTGSYSLLFRIFSSTQVYSSKKMYAFWLGKTALELGRTQSAQEHFREAIRLAPYHYYGLVSHYLLQEPLSSLPNEDIENPSRPSRLSQGLFDRSIQLKDAGEFKQVQEMVKANLSARNSLEEIRFRAYVGDFLSINRIFFNQMGNSERREFIRDHASLIYPKPFFHIVEPEAARWDRISVEYVYAIMRQESMFSPFAHSWANAYGLLQLLPRVARETAERAGVTFENDWELFIPEINIPIGVTHMADNFAENSDNFIVSTASYNATQAVVHEWLRRLYNNDTFEFIEDIPYSETRNYVKLVMRNFLINKRVSATIPFAFPSELLELSPDILPEDGPRLSGVELREAMTSDGLNR